MSFGGRDNPNFNFSVNGDAENRNNTNLARNQLTGTLNELQDPRQFIQQQQDIYRNLMEPQFNLEQQNNYGNQVARLGNRYAGTFGQLTMDQVGQQHAIARANLEKQIYDSGQSALDQYISRAGNQASLYQNMYKNETAPYLDLANLAQSAYGNVDAQNKINASNYSSFLGPLAGLYSGYTSGIGQSNLAAAQANKGGGILSSLAQLGTAAAQIAPLVASDRRLKSNVIQIGSHRTLKIPIYEYDIFGERQVGVMADELEAVMPEAVHTLPSGYKAVYYGMIA